MYSVFIVLAFNVAVAYNMMSGLPVTFVTRILHSRFIFFNRKTKLFLNCSKIKAILDAVLPTVLLLGSNFIFNKFDTLIHDDVLAYNIYVNV